MIDFYFQGNGRISRKLWWLQYFLPLLGVLFASNALSYVLFLIHPYLSVAFIGGLLFTLTYATICVFAKRFHDQNISGWWVLWGWLIILGLTIAQLATAVSLDGIGMVASPIFRLVSLGVIVTQFIVAGFLPGTEGPNAYGQDPLAPDDAETMKDVFS